MGLMPVYKASEIFRNHCDKKIIIDAVGLNNAFFDPSLAGCLNEVQNWLELIELNH